VTLHRLVMAQMGEQAGPREANHRVALVYWGENWERRCTPIGVCRRITPPVCANRDDCACRRATRRRVR